MDKNILSEKELLDALKSLPDWEVRESTLTKEFTFPDFVTAADFLQDLVSFFEETKHHPDIYISYNIIRFTLTSHEAGNVLTKSDVVTAMRIEENYEGLVF